MKLFKSLAIFAAILGLFGCCSMQHSQDRQNAWVRNRILQLSSPDGTLCTGVQVHAPSGKAYVLTAGHCMKLAVGDKIMSQNEQGVKAALTVLKEDMSSDLLLLSAPDDKGVEIASRVAKHQHVYTMTHGDGMPAYRTDGEVLEIKLGMFLDHTADKAEDMVTCMKPKQKFLQDEGGQFACVVAVYETVATATIIPGSSGGPLLNDKNELMGIASMTDGKFGWFVTLQDIKTFLKDK